MRDLKYIGLMHSSLGSLISLSLSFALCTGCDDSSDSEMVNTSKNDMEVAGMESAGESMAGETVAGESVAGESVAGESVAGESVAGESVAGESVAGESVAGETVAGETVSSDPMINRGTYAYPGAVPGQYVLSNAPSPCEQISSVAPYLPDEAGHHIGGVFTPPQYPFTAQMIEYTLEEPPDVETCHSELGHQLELSILSDQQALPINPMTETRVHFSFEIASALMETERRVIIQYLEEPVVLMEGEQLLISIPLKAEGMLHLCAAICEDEVATPNATLWSDAAEPPYAWSDLSSFGITGEVLIKVIGE